MDASSRSELNLQIRQQEAVAELGQLALETDDVDELMQSAVQTVATVLDNEYCKVLELRPERDELFLRHGVGWQDECVREAVVPTDLNSQAGYTLVSEEPVIVADLEAESRFSGPDLLVDHNVVSGISVVIGSVHSPWGVLGTHATERRAFTEREAKFVQNVANILASAIENDQVQNELEETKSRLEAATAAGSVGTWTWDIQNDVVTVDEYLARAYGVDPDVSETGAPMDTFYEPIHEDDVAETRAQLDRAVEETGELDTEYRVAGPDGEISWILARGEVEYDDEGEPVRMYGAISDITERKAHQQRLERYKQYTDDILNTIDDIFYVIDDAGELQRWNQSVNEVTGYTDDEIASMNALGFFDEDTDVIADAIAEGFETGTALVEARLRTKDGESIPYEFAAATLRDSEGNPVLAGIGRDITARKERERELTKYETIVETVDDGIYVIDEEGRFTMVNDAYAELTGYDREELIGEHASLVVDEETIARSKNISAESADDTTTKPTMEAEIRRADGATVPAEATFTTLQSADGDAKEVGVVRDITERKQQRRKLEESERRYRTLAEHFPNGAVGVYDEDLRYNLIEGDALGGSMPSSDALEGKTVAEIFPDETRADIEPLFRAAIDEGELGSATTEFGGRHWRVWATPLRDTEGDIFAGLSFAQDVTEQVEREQRLEELVEKLETSNERLEQFAYAASHDLQEPLRMVSSYLQLIEQRYADDFDADGEEFLQFAMDGASRMRSMIQGLLQYSRVETQGDPFTTVDLDVVLDEVRDDLQMRIEESDAEISADPLPVVEGDAGQLRQLFQNLLENAIEYSGDEPPDIRISATQNGDRWVVSIQDDGIGIDPDDIDRVFEVFQSLHPQGEHPGTGIGLALCKRIVERHGGDIWVESTPGEGATFSFTLPAASDEK